MIGHTILDKNGKPISSNGTALTESKLTLPQEVKDLFTKVQNDYQTAYSLQNKPFDEFDGYSLLQRAKMDQETFAAFVGVQFEAKDKRWKWKGRKNTARNKLIGILGHIIAGMLYPFVYAQNDQDEEDKITAQAMRILVEERLKKANYEIRFFYAVLSALVNPACTIEVEFIEELMSIRERMKDGKMNVRQVVDEAMSGLFLHIIPIDEIMFGDFYSGTGDIQAQPFIIRKRRISYEAARGKYAGKYFYEGKDLFDYVHAGQTHWLSTDEHRTLFDVELDEADRNFVQELTIRYRKDDLELTFVGGVGMFDYQNPYNNPMKHRRMCLDRDKSWYTAPQYPFAITGFEPIDPQGRFLWFKSGAFKEYWDDRKINELDRMLVDGVKLDIFKPMFLAGVAQIDERVMVPGATVAMPVGATATPYMLGPNLVQAYNVITQANDDMSESTQDKIMQGQTEKGITATQTEEARTNARIFLGVFGFMIANLVKQIGELVIDCIIMYDTVGELDALSGENFRVKYRTFLAKGKENGKNVTNRMMFTDAYMGRKMSEDRVRDIEWDLYEKAGKEESDQRIWMINPYRFARTRYSMYIDADQIVMKSMGVDRIEKDRAFEKFMDPRVMPFIDPEAVVQDFVIDEYAGGDPDRYKTKQGQEDLVNALLGQAQQGAAQPVA